MILAADWIFPITSPPLPRHAIEIENGIIRAIRPVRYSDSFSPSTCLLPGLVNAHTHLAYTAFRNVFDELEFFPWIRKLTETKYQKLTENEIIASTRLGIAECLRSGITTVADMSDLEPALKALSQSPLRGVFYWEVFGVEQEQAERTWKSLQGIYPAMVREYGTERLILGVSPHACYTVRPELYIRIGEWALQEKIPVSFHLAESKEEEEFIGKRSGIIQNFLQQRAADWGILGSTSVTHLEQTGIFQTKPLLAHLVQVNAQDIEILLKYKVSIAHCPKSNAKFGHGVAPLTEFVRKGFRIGIGTDSPASNNRLDLFEEARFGLLQQRIQKGEMVLSEKEMLEMLTLKGAEALGLENQIGSLEIGKKADIISLKIPPYYAEPDQVLRHLIHNSTSSDIIDTFIDGKRVALSSIEDEIKTIYQKISPLRR